MINLKKIVLVFCLMGFWGKACRYTVREIGFSTLSNTNYVLYRVGANASFPDRVAASFSDTNIGTYAMTMKSKVADEVVRFVKKEKLKLPAYILKDKAGRFLALPNNDLVQLLLETPVQHEIIKRLPDTYAMVLFVEGTSQSENKKALQGVQKAVQRIENNMPNMPKQVAHPPFVVSISQADFEREKVLLWSVGLEKPPQHPTAFVLYGKGRMMGDLLTEATLSQENTYRLLSFIGADCECGLDRKWMFGDQVPLKWGREVRDRLRDILEFDVDHPMVLTEMGRILATKKKAITSDEAIAFEPVRVDLSTAFDEELPKENKESTAGTANESSTVIYISLGVLALLVVGVVLFLVKKR